MLLRSETSSAVLLVVSLALGALASSSCGTDRRDVFDDVDGGSGGAGLVSSGSGGIGLVSSSGSGGIGLVSSSGGGGGASSLSPACDAPEVAPSAGSCIPTFTEDVACNPVTNEPCSQYCGNYGTGLWQCYTTTLSLEAVCAPCDDSEQGCIGGAVCPATEDWPGGYQCAKHCCDDGDCGSGTCYKDGIATPDAPVGICLQ